MSFLCALVSALLTGALFAAAFPPFGQWWLAWLWALPLFWRVWQPVPLRGWRLFLYGFRHGWLAGVFVFTGTIWWTAHVTAPGMVALCVYLALYPAVWGGMAALLRPETPGRGLLAALALALLWVGLEWERGVFPILGFPWNGAAVPLVEMPGLRSLAAYAGATGLSLLPFIFMGGIAAAWMLRRHRSVRGRAVLLAFSLATPAVVTIISWQKSPQPSGRVQVILVQPNVGMADKLNPENEVQRYQDLATLTVTALQHSKSKPALIVWPESALPRPFHDRMHEEYFASLFKAGADTILTGADALTAESAGAEDWSAHNCAALMRGDYDSFVLHAKVQLVPFGEYIPFRRELPFLEDMLGDLIPSDFAAGTSLEPLRMDGLAYEIIPLICFEDTIARVARKFVRDVPQLMVNITNDNWFAESNESAIHALNARWRCLELQRPMVRSANTGVTCVIDTEGRLTSELPRWKQGVLHASVPLVPGGLTFYAAHGDVIPIAAGIAGLVLAVMLLFIRHTNA